MRLGHIGDEATNSAPSKPRHSLSAVLAASVITIGLLAHARPASAAVLDGCIDDVFHDLNGGGHVNCTANDIEIAAVTSVTILDDGCTSIGDTVTFNATVTVLLTAQGAGRSDIGIYIATDGGNALTGTCLVDNLPLTTDLDGIGDDTDMGSSFGYCSPDFGTSLSVPTRGCNEDGDCSGADTCEDFGPGFQDTCGDIDNNQNPLFTTLVSLTILCVDNFDEFGDPGSDGFADLANCASWSQAGGNELCLTERATFPANASKCNCEVLQLVQIQSCGDGIVNVPGETCDPPGNSAGLNGNFCRADCTVCGDDNVDAGEQCDDNDGVNGNGCENDCTLTPFCGDGSVNAPGETCEPIGAPVGSPGETCRGDCTFCGDGNQDAGEACDDGNETAGDNCENDCTVTPPFCGDGSVNAPGETCELPGDPAGVHNNACRSDCTVCGDGIQNGGEQCDDGNTDDADACKNDCTLPPAPGCGDGTVIFPETCDPPGSSAGGNGNLCRVDCTVCGDTIVDGGEACDDGNGINGDGCENDCSGTPLPPPPPPPPPPPICGDNILDPGEECDDGNNINADGCEADCTLPFCGNSILDPGEECESDADCPTNTMCALPAEPDECRCLLVPFCGDFNVDTLIVEECDPPLGPVSEICGNNIDDDGDGLVDCGDPDCPAFCEVGGILDPGEPCMTHRDCRKKFGQAAECVSVGTCGDDCRLENFCLRIDKDPAKIRFGNLPWKLDLFTGHGRFVVERERDPTTEGFQVTLSNKNRTIFAGILVPGHMTQKGKGFRYKNKRAKIDGGLDLVRLKFKIHRGRLTLFFRVKAYGNFSEATEPEMTIRVRIGAQGGFHEGAWDRTNAGWRIAF